MSEHIKSKIKELSEKEGIDILLAAEGGSRSWGIPSQDSPYEIGLIYMEKADQQAGIEKISSLSKYEDKELRFMGWGLRETFYQLKNSERRLFEWLQSPVIYQQDPTFKAEMWKLAQQYFQPIRSLEQYQKAAIDHLHDDPDYQQMKLDQLFMLLQPVLAAKWVMDNSSIPPVEFRPLLNQVESEGLEDDIKNMVKIKRQAEGQNICHVPISIRAFVNKELRSLKSYLPESRPKGKNDPTALEEYFRQLTGSEL